jgi:hypothetical protein
MFKVLLSSIVVCAALGVQAARIQFDLSQITNGLPPAGFVGAVNGAGRPGEWKVLQERVPPVIAPFTPNAIDSVAQRPVLAQVSDTGTPNHSALLLYTNEVFADFTFSARVKIVGGVFEPCAGLVFRAQDTNNFYVLRVSAQGNLLWFRVVGGHPYENLGIGVLTPIKSGEWHDLSVRCTGSGLRCFLDGKLALPPVKPGSPTNELQINDTTFATGQIGLWTKADTTAYFADAHVEFTPRVPFMQLIADDTSSRYPRLLGLKIFGRKDNAPFPVVIADPREHVLGTPGTKVENDVMARGSIYFQKKSGQVEVTMPLRDRNGEAVAALRVTMKAFKGETQETAIARATIVKKDLEARLATLQDINQ